MNDVANNWSKWVLWLEIRWGRGWKELGVVGQCVVRAKKIEMQKKKKFLETDTNRGLKLPTLGKKINEP